MSRTMDHYYRAIEKMAATIPVITGLYVTSQRDPDSHGYLQPLATALMQHVTALLTVKSYRGAQTVLDNLDGHLSEAMHEAATVRSHYAVRKSLIEISAALAIYRHAVAMRKANKEW